MTSKGAVPVVILLYLAGAAALTQLVPNWRVSHLFAKKPPVAQLSAAQVALDKAEAELAVLRAAQAAQVVEAAAKRDQELRIGQGYVEGTGEALQKVPVEHQVKEVRAAMLLNGRAAIAFSLALGKLPQAQQDEMLKLVNGLVSAKQDEVDNAMALVVKLDGELQIVQSDKVKAEKQVAVLTENVAAKETKVAALEETVVKKTEEVKTWASEKVKADAESGSLKATVIRYSLWIGGIFLFVNFILPSLAAQFPLSKWLQKFYQSVASLTSAHEIPKS